MFIESVASKTVALDIKSRISAYLLPFWDGGDFFISLIRLRTSFKIRRSTRASSDTAFTFISQSSFLLFTQGLYGVIGLFSREGRL